MVGLKFMGFMLVRLKLKGLLVGLPMIALAVVMVVGGCVVVGSVVEGCVGEDCVVEGCVAYMRRVQNPKPGNTKCSASFSYFSFAAAVFDQFIKAAIESHTTIMKI